MNNLDCPSKPLYDRQLRLQWVRYLSADPIPEDKIKNGTYSIPDSCSAAIAMIPIREKYLRKFSCPSYNSDPSNHDFGESEIGHPHSKNHLVMLNYSCLERMSVTVSISAWSGLEFQVTALAIADQRKFLLGEPPR